MDEQAIIDELLLIRKECMRREDAKDYSAVAMRTLSICKEEDFTTLINHCRDNGFDYCIHTDDGTPWHATMWGPDQLRSRIEVVLPGGVYRR